MSRDFLQDLPEHLRAIYDKPAEPSPQRTFYQTQIEAEELKEKTRKNSVLYKHIFKEDLFTFMTSEGRLHLDIKLLNPLAFFTDISRESVLMFARYVQLKHLPNGYVSYELTHKDTKQVKMFIKTYLSAERSDQIKAAVVEIDSALKKLQDDYLGDFQIPLADQQRPIYLNHEQRVEINAMETMMAAFYSTSHPSNNSSNMDLRRYFAHALKPKIVADSMSRINWYKELQPVQQ